MPNISKQANNREYKMFLPYFPWETHLKNAFWDSCSNKMIDKIKKLLLLIENYLIYNIILSGKLNHFLIKIKSQLYLNYEFF